MFGSSTKITKLQREITELKAALKKEKSFSEGRLQLLNIIGLDVKHLEGEIGLGDTLWDAMDPLTRVINYRLRACRVERDDLSNHFSQKGIDWSNKILNSLMKYDASIDINSIRNYVIFSSIFNAKLETFGFEDMYELVNSHIQSNRSELSEDMMWLSNPHVLIEPVLYYIVEKKKMGNDVHHFDFIKSLDMHVIANIIATEDISEACRNKLTGYLDRIGFSHCEENGLNHHKVQNFCMGQAIASIFDLKCSRSSSTGNQG